MSRVYPNPPGENINAALFYYYRFHVKPSIDGLNSSDALLVQQDEKA
jgi:hypothetical protein